ncbi:hypothetical protein C10C_0258 [Chlamydia serpentis]|uniref:Uncharacterized protein n=1 Tax=Chlamydia serpentis TaxID=1967782 RepID=A0A2R8FAS8_9CHLA|nr:hypothetical protein [Chlamydia serpentis]SPN73432.1 hypothetical protein C10C_0258 [Chlamydia serpentis]
MSCFNLPAANAKLNPISLESCSLRQQWVANYHSLSNRACTPGALSSPICKVNKYSVNLSIRLTLIVLAVLVVLVGFSIMVVSVQGGLLTIGWPLIAAALLVPMILLTGGMYVLHRLGKKIDVFSGTRISLFSRRYWVPITCGSISKSSDQTHINLMTYLDMSTLSEQGSGIAPVYIYPPLENRIPLGLAIPAAIPFVALFRMVYNLIRFLVVPFYIIFRMIYEYFCCKHLSKENKFICRDIVREMSRSLVAFLKAPFYAVATVIGAFYGFLDPLAGRVMMGNIERDWNDDIILSRSISMQGMHSLFRFEGGGDRQGLGQQGFYLLVCCQPIAIFFFEKGDIVFGAHTSFQIPERRTSKRVFRYPDVGVIPNLSCNSES